MCSQCRTASVESDWYAEGAVDTLAGRRAARAELARAMSAVISAIGLSAKAHPGAMSITVSTATGRSAMVAAFDEVQASIATLSGAALDPLDTTLLERLEAGRR